jgi:hypothetical protein
MARTVQEIKTQMTDAFMADQTIRERYGLREGDTFSSRFSVASIESILFFIVASAHYVLERIFDQFKADVIKQINSSVVATIPWYHQQALNYQHGDKLQLDERTLQWKYPTVDESKRLVRYVAVKDHGGSIQVLVSKEKDGLPEPLTEDELRSFTAYMSSIKIAGVILSVRSLPADTLSIKAKIQLDPLVYLPSGVSIRDGKRPVEDAIRTYLREITYGGVFNKMKLVDAIQRVEGVLDVELGECTAEPHKGTQRIIQGNNYSARSGCFLAPSLTTTLSYIY